MVADRFLTESIYGKEVISNYELKLDEVDETLDNTQWRVK